MGRLQIPALVLVMLASACSGCHSQPPPQPMLQPMPPPPAPPPAPAVAAPCDQPQALAVSAMMQARAAAEAPGMKPDGAPVCGVVRAPGETVSSALFLLEPGYCYTFLGQSLPPVGEMDMALVLDGTAVAGSFLPPSMSNMANMAQAQLLVSTTPGERISMGEKRNCYQAPGLPGTVKLVLKSRAGAGPMAAQAYRKKI